MKIIRGKVQNFLGAVVLVGLWDTNNECILNVRTGFVADNSAGLIMAAGHIFITSNKVQRLIQNTKIIRTLGPLLVIYTSQSKQINHFLLISLKL